MIKRLCVQEPPYQIDGHWRPATPAEIAEAAGMAELRQLESTIRKMVSDNLSYAEGYIICHECGGSWKVGFPSSHRDNCVNGKLHAAIALCEPKQVTG